MVLTRHRPQKINLAKHVAYMITSKPAMFPMICPSECFILDGPHLMDLFGQNSQHFRQRSHSESIASTTINGPFNWFRLRVPAGVIVRKTGQRIEIQVASADVTFTDQKLNKPQTQSCRGTADTPVLVIDSQWMDDPNSPTESCFADIVTFYPIILASRPEPIVDTAQTQTDQCLAECWSGIARTPHTGKWWQRLFRRKPTIQWWFCTLRMGHIRVRARINSVAGSLLDPWLVAACESILGSICISETPAMPFEIFRNRVLLAASRHFPLLSLTTAGRHAICVEDSSLDLSHLYKTYLDHPERFEQIVLPAITTIVRMRELSPDQLLPPLNLARHRILPMLSQKENATSDDLVAMPWIAGLSVNFVLDDQNAYRYVCHAMLQKWKLNLEELFKMAIQNLEQRATEHEPEDSILGSTDDPRMLMLTYPDAYNSAQILSPAFQQKLRRTFGPHVIVGIPNHDSLLAVAEHHETLISHVQLLVDTDYQNHQHPLTKRLLLVSADGVSEF